MPKFYGKKIFKISDILEATCESQNTRYGFRHVGTLYENGQEIATAKCCYYNRTWEVYTYQTLLFALIKRAEKHLGTPLYNAACEYIQQDHTDWTGFNTIAVIAKMGEIFAPDQKGANDWKARMLKAGLEGRGLIMPEDWDQLSEEEKQKRLDGAISVLSQKK